MESIDDAVVIWLNRRACRERTVRVATHLMAERLASVEIALMLLLAVGGRKHSALKMLGSVAAVYVAVELLGAAWPRERPFARLTEIQQLVPHDPYRSFPSRHVASGLAMAAIGSEQHRRLGQTMTVVAWLLGVSRVAAGLHYPSDILAGAVLGITLGRFVHML